MRHDYVFMQSSMLSSCWYDDESKEMGVTFSNGREYVYENVEKSIYDTLTDPKLPSAGKFFNSIKSGLTVKK